MDDISALTALHTSLPLTFRRRAVLYVPDLIPLTILFRRERIYFLKNEVEIYSSHGTGIRPDPAEADVVVVFI
jgi:hypothetical protein